MLNTSRDVSGQCLSRALQDPASLPVLRAGSEKLAGGALKGIFRLPPQVR